MERLTVVTAAVAEVCFRHAALQHKHSPAIGPKRRLQRAEPARQGALSRNRRARRPCRRCSQCRRRGKRAPRPTIKTEYFRRHGFFESTISRCRRSVVGSRLHPNGARPPMLTSRRSIFAGLSAALLLSAITVSHAAAQELKEVRIGFQKAGIFPVVKQRGTLEKVLQSRGIQVKWVEFQFGPPILEAINTGNVDFGYAGDAPPIFAQAARANLLYVAAIPSRGYNQGIVVPDSSAIRTLADLKGKKVGFGKGSSAHNTIVAALEAAGLSYSDITPVYLGPADAVAAFASGNIDAWSIWDPYLSLAENKNARVIAFSKDVQQSNSFFLANKDFTAAHGDLVALFNTTFAEEGKWANANRADVAARLHEATGVDKMATARAVERSDYTLVPVDDRIIATQQQTADRFFKLGLIPKAVDVKEIVWKWTPGS